MNFWKRKSRWDGIDVLDLIPGTMVDFYLDEATEQVILQVPRFREPWLGPWIQRVLPLDRKFFRVPLDPRGTLLWQSIDGKRTVRSLVEDVLKEFPEDLENIHERVSVYLMSHYQNKFINFLNLR